MGSLAEAIKNARRYADKYETWCLVRFNKIDKTIETYQSQQERSGAVFAPKSGSPPIFELKEVPNPSKEGVRQEIVRSNTGAPKGGRLEGGGRAQWEKVGDFLIEARHAENFVCRNFKDLLDAFGLVYGGGPPTRVEFFLRDSPCLGNSMQEDAPYNLKGCAPKLIALKHAYGQIGTWILYYDRLYVSPQHSAEDARAALRLLGEAGYGIHEGIPADPDNPTAAKVASI